MLFQSRVFRLAKDTEHPEEDQDAYGLNPERGIAVVADGVASAIFSRQWAIILAEATIADTPDPRDKDVFAQWLALRRQAWSEQIDVTGLAWFQKAKLPLGAFSTLLFVCTEPVEEPREGAFGAHRLQGFAIGDSCLFHVRDGELVRTFPIQTSAELEDDPVVLGSVDLGRDQLMEFATLDELCYPDDLIVLCTDAVAEWALRRIESGNPPDWERYWGMTELQWQEEVVGLRDRREMRYDDATLVLLCVAPQGVEIEPPREEPISTTPEQETVPSGEEPIVAEIVDSEPQVEPDDDTTAAEPDDWQGKLKSAGEQVADGIELASEQMVRGLKKWKEKAVRKYREKFKRDDE